MDELKRLVKLVVQRSGRSLPLISQLDESSLETKLYNLVRKGKVETDEDAAFALYSTNGSSTNYRMLKSRVRRKLFNQLYFLEFPPDKFEPSNVEGCRIEATLLEAQILITANEYKIADRLLTQAVAAASAHQLNKKIVRALELRQTVSFAVGDKRQFKEITTELQKYYEIEAFERKAILLYRTTAIELKSNVSDRNSQLANVPDVIQELECLWQKSQSSRIFSIYHILGIHYMELCGNYHAIADAVEKAEQILLSGALHPSWFDHKYNSFIRIYALFRTRQFEEGLRLAKRYLPQFDPKTINWFAFMENYLLLALHAGKYSLAGSLLHDILGNDFFSEIQETAKERWELYRQYLLYMSGMLPDGLQVELPKNIFAELVALPKDKAGFNLSLLILDVINSFASIGMDDYGAQEARVKKYIVKYMRGDKAERPRLFLRLLLLAMKHGLDFLQTQGASENLYERLCHLAPPGDAFAEVEIVPYEHLWEAVLIALRKRVKEQP